MVLSVDCLVFILAVIPCRGSPVHKGQDNNELKQTTLNNRNTSTTDRIIFINEENRKNGLYEGDIVLTDHDHVDTSTSGDVDGPIKTNLKRNAQRSRQGLWVTRVVPFAIDSTIAESFVLLVKSAIDDFNKLSCVQWIPKNDKHRNWVRIYKGDGCFSSVGMKYWLEGSQDMSLGGGCYKKGTIQHEMLHAIGFWHEQSRPDRNQYVEVLWENIRKGMEFNFNKYSHGTIDTLNKNYDYSSLMHYGKMGFSVNGKPTLQAIGDSNRDIGQRNGLSPNDVLEVNALYDCKTPNGGWSVWSDYSPCDSQCYKSRQRFCTAEDRSRVCPEANSYGVQTEYKYCALVECNAPVNGHWGRWASWGACSTTCSDGIRTRTRVCSDPPPSHGGSDCAGSNTHNTKCNLRSCSLGLDDCEFQDFCFWTQDATDSSPQAWMLNSGQTSSSGTGPLGDHTTGLGNYIYAEASSPVAPGDTARLLSKTFPATSGRCMQFWYNMNGTEIGGLNVYVKDAATKRMAKVWALSGNQGQPWRNGSVTIKSAGKYVAIKSAGEYVAIKSAGEYVVVFEAVRGPGYQSDVALDDVVFTDGSCAHAAQPTEPAPTPTTIATTTAAPTTQAPTLPPADSCNFGTQSGTLCTWSNDQTNPKTPDDYYRFDWWTHSGQTPSAVSDTGPPAGRGGSGYYIYLETSSPYQPGMKGRLVSKQYQASSSMCVSFWYFMYGSGVDSLSVFIEDNSGRSKLWTNTGNHGNAWLQAKVSLSSNSTFKIILEGTRGANYMGDIGLDDITVSYGHCV